MGESELRRLNVGSGTDSKSGWLNADLLPWDDVDLLCDVHHLPFRNRSFDIVYTRDLIHHVLDPESAIRELCRVAGDRVEIWESNRYNPYMFLFMVMSGFEHNHLSRRQLKQMFRSYVAVFKEENDYDHFHSRPIFKAFNELLKMLSLLIPSYNVAIVRRSEKGVL